jgi:hypothetical protein
VTAAEEPPAREYAKYQSLLEQLKKLYNQDRDLRKIYTSEAVIVKENKAMIDELENQRKQIEEEFRRSGFNPQGAPRVVDFNWTRSSANERVLSLQTTTPFFAGETLEAVRKLGTPDKQDFDWDYGQSISRVLITREPNKHSVVRDFQAMLPANFSPEYDLQPAWQRFKIKYSQEPFPLFPNESTPILKITNAMQRQMTAALGLRFTQPTNIVEPQKAFAQIRGFQKSGPYGAFNFRTADISDRYRVEAIEWIDKNEGSSMTTYLSGHEGKSTEAFWKIPNGSDALERWTGPADFEITPAKPFDVFTLTNKTGQILRARLAFIDTSPLLFEFSQIVESENSILMEGFAAVGPNEKLRFVTIHSGGNEEVHETPFNNSDDSRKRVTCLWPIPEGLRGNALTIIANLQAKFLRRQIALEPGGNFTLANLGGEQVMALQFLRTPPPPQ